MQQQELVLLIKACKQNNQKAQIAVYDLFFKAMYNTAFRFVQQQDVAEDITQDAFIVAFTKMNSLQNEITFSKWLKQIVVNKSLTYLKQKKKFCELPINLYSISIDEPEGFEIAVADVGVQNIIKAINSLKDNYRILLTLHYIEGFDYDEIVKITGFTHVNCRTIISRAKISLKKKLKRC